MKQLLTKILVFTFCLALWGCNFQLQLQEQGGTNIGNPDKATTPPIHEGEIGSGSGNDLPPFPETGDGPETPPGPAIDPLPSATPSPSVAPSPSPASNLLPPPSPSPSPSATPEGLGYLLWSQESTGQAIVWRMNDSTYERTSTVVNHTVAPGWEAQSIQRLSDGSYWILFTNKTDLQEVGADNVMVFLDKDGKDHNLFQYYPRVPGYYARSHFKTGDTGYVLYVNESTQESFVHRLSNEGVYLDEPSTPIQNHFGLMPVSYINFGGHHHVLFSRPALSATATYLTTLLRMPSNQQVTPMSLYMDLATYGTHGSLFNNDVVGRSYVQKSDSSAKLLLSSSQNQMADQGQIVQYTILDPGGALLERTKTIEPAADVPRNQGWKLNHYSEQ